MLKTKAPNGGTHIIVCYENQIMRSTVSADDRKTTIAYCKWWYTFKCKFTLTWSNNLTTWTTDLKIDSALIKI